jgi:hypothetical protein
MESYCKILYDFKILKLRVNFVKYINGTLWMKFSFWT